MIKTVVKNGNVDAALKRFKQQSAKSGTLSEFRKREYYSKPGVLRREAKKNAIIRLFKFSFSSYKLYITRQLV